MNVGWIAYTSKVCSPGSGPPTEYGDSHTAASPPSTEHSKRVPTPLVEKVNVARGSLLAMSGPDSIMVIGAVRSPMVHSYSAHCSSKIPSGSLARTAKL